MKSTLFLAHSRLFQVISGCFLLVVGRLKSFLARCRSFQVVSCSFQVVSGRFLLVVGRFRSFQIVSGRFRSFRVLGGTPMQKVSHESWPSFACDLSGCGFESRCCHLNFRYGASFEQGVP